MRYISDFHIHSKYSRSCSTALNLENINKACRTKGVDIIGTGDFTFPDWFKSINAELTEIGKTGLYKLKNVDDDKVKFILTSEVALIYKKGDRARRIHIVMHAPNIESVKALNEYLDGHYNIRSDGRPILGMSAETLMKLCFSINPEFLIYPAHIWTPWFAVFGSKSGFDSMEECFGEYAESVFAYETGLSSDPEMNWQLSALDKYTLLSNSDAHSLPNICREANVFELVEASYDMLNKVIKKEASKENYLNYTIEFYPEEGMYHYDGHRDCGVCFSPTETKKHKGVCPKCGKDVVVGVDYRVNELADRKHGFKPAGAPSFRKLVELDKIIAESIGVKSRTSKKVQDIYHDMIKIFGTEMNILLDEKMEAISEHALPAVSEGIKRVREGNLDVCPGFDGQYGVVKIFTVEERKKQSKLAI